MGQNAIAQRNMQMGVYKIHGSGAMDNVYLSTYELHRRLSLKLFSPDRG